jgi:hypothetical protein
MSEKALSWGEIKAQVEKAGVKDDDLVWIIDLGPGSAHVYVDRDHLGFVEIGDEPQLASKEERCKTIRKKKQRISEAD